MDLPVRRTPGKTVQEATAAKFDLFRVLTHNTLHGLEVGAFWVKPGESKEARTERFTLQFRRSGPVLSGRTLDMFR